MDSPLTILGLSPGASADEVRAAYQKLARRYPPELAPREFARVHRAYQLLRSPARRFQAAWSSPEEAVGGIGGREELQLGPPRPAPPPLAESALEPLIAPLRRAHLARLLARFLG
jgi:molecular chaperone DnaJ